MFTAISLNFRAHLPVKVCGTVAPKPYHALDLSFSLVRSPTPVFNLLSCSFVCSATDSFPALHLVSFLAFSGVLDISTMAQQGNSCHIVYSGPGSIPGAHLVTFLCAFRVSYFPHSNLITRWWPSLEHNSLNTANGEGCITVPETYVL